MSEHTTDMDAGATRLERSRSDRTLAGVAGGLGAYFELHPAVFRVTFVVLTLLGGAGTLIYLAAALVMPDEGTEDSIAAAALRRRRPWVLVVLGLLAFVLLATLSEVPVWPAGDAWAFLLIAGAGVLWLIWFALSGARSGWVRAVVLMVTSMLVLLVLLVAAFFAVFDLRLGDGVAERRLVPTSVADLRQEYKLGVGELELDLRSISFPPGETRLNARVGAGRIRVLVPEDVALSADAVARLGEIRLLDRRVEGWKVSDRVDETGVRVLVLDAEVGLGEIQILRGLR